MKSNVPESYLQIEQMTLENVETVIGIGRSQAYESYIRPKKVRLLMNGWLEVTIDRNRQVYLPPQRIVKVVCQK